MSSTSLMRYTQANIVFFPYITRRYEHFLHTGPNPLCVEIPLYVLNRMQIFHEEGIVHVHKKEIVPIFFTHDSTANEAIFRKIAEDNFKTFTDDFKKTIIGEDKKMWIFGNDQILIDLAAGLEQSKFPKIFFYPNDESEIPKVCELTFPYSEKHRQHMPLFQILEAEAICKN